MEWIKATPNDRSKVHGLFIGDRFLVQVHRASKLERGHLVLSYAHDIYTLWLIPESEGILWLNGVRPRHFGECLNVKSASNLDILKTQPTISKPNRRTVSHQSFGVDPRKNELSDSACILSSIKLRHGSCPYEPNSTGVDYQFGVYWIMIDETNAIGSVVIQPDGVKEITAESARHGERLRFNVVTYNYIGEMAENVRQKLLEKVNNV